MCTVSMVAQDWHDRWRDRFPPNWPDIPNTSPVPTPADWERILTPPAVPVTRAEFDALKTELESLKKLLKAAKQYDEETGQKDCEDADKVELFRRLAKMCGVDMSEVFAK